MVMFTKQISVFLENRQGRLAELTELLARQGLNIRAMSLADTVDFGVLRLIVNDTAACLNTLCAHDFAAQETEVLAVQIADRPGSLHQLVELLDRHGLNIEYMYTFFGKTGGNVIVVFKASDPARAAQALTDAGVALLGENVIQNL
jgi:hypothetical protein